MADTTMKPDQNKSPQPNMTGMSDFVPPVKPKSVAKIFMTLLLVLVVLAVIGGGTYWVLTHKTTKKSTATTKASASSQPASVTKIASNTTQYNSSDYGLALNYPSDWTVNDVAGNNMTVTSPALQLVGSGSQTFTGQVVLTIQNQQTTIPPLAAGTAVAALESQKLTYKSPTPDQRAQTYLTFVNYAGATGSLNALYITGDNGYQVGQTVPMSDLTQDDPLISVTFTKCSDTTCKAAPTAATITSGSWSSDTGLAKPVVAMLESLTIN